MKNTYITSNDRRVYENNNDVTTEINKIEATNPSPVSKEENYLEKDRLLEVLKTLFIKGCSRSVNIFANSMGVSVPQIKALLTEMNCDLPSSGSVCREVQIQIGNQYEISFCGDNCTFNNYNVDRETFEKMYAASKDKDKKLRGKKK